VWNWDINEDANEEKEIQRMFFICCDGFNKTVTVILDVTKETGFPLSYILAYKRCGRYSVRRCEQILDT
jgi:hypothetical protein